MCFGMDISEIMEDRKIAMKIAMVPGWNLLSVFARSEVNTTLASRVGRPGIMFYPCRPVHIECTKWLQVTPSDQYFLVWNIWNQPPVSTSKILAIESINALSAWYFLMCQMGQTGQTFFASRWVSKISSFQLGNRIQLNNALEASEVGTQTYSISNFRCFAYNVRYDRMSKYMLERMSDRMSEWICHIIIIIIV